MTSITVAYGGQFITAELQWRERATLDIAVSPLGSIDVTAPMNADLDAVEDAVRRRARWVLAQQRYFAQFRPRTPPRRWLPGETHQFLGRQHRLRIGNPTAPRGIRRTRGVLFVDGVAFDDTSAIERTMREWYRARAHELVPERLAACAERFSDTPLPTDITVRSMTSRWASMSANGRLTVNPELLRAPIDAIDYVLTHELAHLIVADHGPAFTTLLAAVMPDHDVRKRRLELATA